MPEKYLTETGWSPCAGGGGMVFNINTNISIKQEVEQ
jgi:hypothetical protein